MATVDEVMTALRAKATEQYCRTYIRHGMAAARVLGVSSADMKALAKQEITALLSQAVTSLAGAEDRVKSAMNAFVIAIGCYVEPVAREAKAAARQLGTVTAEAGDTDCRIPVALAYIEKVVLSGKAFVKRKTIRC